MMTHGPELSDMLRWISTKRQRSLWRTSLSDAALVILWESEGTDSLHPRTLYISFKGGICCRTREEVLVCEHGAGGSVCYCAAA